MDPDTVSSEDLFLLLVCFSASNLNICYATVIYVFYCTVCVLFVDPDVLRLDFRVNGHVYLRYDPLVRFSR